MKKKILLILAVIVLAVTGHLIAYYIVKIPTQLEMLLLLGAALFLPTVRNPLLGLYVVFILSPFIPFFRRFYYLAYERPAQDPLIVVGDMILSFILIGLFFEFRDRGNQDRDVKPFMITVILYFCYILIRTFVFNEIGFQAGILSFKFYGPPVLFFLIGVIFAHRLPDMKRLWIFTVIIGLISSLYGIKQLYLGFSKAEHLWFASTSFTTLYIGGIARAFSFFSAPAAFADYAQLTVLGVLMIFSWSKSPARYLLLLVIPVAAYAILITSVRSSWIGLVASLLLWILVTRMKGTGRRLILVAAAVIFYVVYQFMSDTIGSGQNLDSMVQSFFNLFSTQPHLDMLISDRASALSNPFEEYSFLSRVALWKYIVALSTNPQMAILGRGIGALNADSLYITYLAELGYPGFLFIIAFLSVLLIIGLNAFDKARNPSVRYLIGGITVMNIVIALTNITGTHIHSFPGDIYFWFWNGVMVKLASRPDLLQESAFSAQGEPAS